MIATNLYVTHPDLALVPTSQSLSDTRIEVVADAGTDPAHDVYYFWIEAPNFDVVEAALTEDHTVADFASISGTDQRWTYRIAYTDAAKLFTPTITEIGGITRAARIHSKGWQLHMELPDHAALSALAEHASTEDIQLDLLDLRHQAASNDRSEWGLTDAQREALVSAFVQGYYDEPREASLVDLAALFGISQPAMSGRIKRGSARLIKAVLIDDPDNDRETDTRC